jgi:hypothetical protein
MPSPSASVSGQGDNPSAWAGAETSTSNSPAPIQPRHHRMRRRPFLPPRRRPGVSEHVTPSPSPAAQPNNAGKSPSPSAIAAPTSSPKP